MIPYPRLNLFKTMMKFLNHTMQTSGATDKVRNLIESSLPLTCQFVMLNQRIFGASIYALCIFNILYD